MGASQTTSPEASSPSRTRTLETRDGGEVVAQLGGVCQGAARLQIRLAVQFLGLDVADSVGLRGGEQQKISLQLPLARGLTATN